MLSVDVEKRLGEFSIAAKFETAAGATALFGPSGAGKTSLVNMIAGLLTPDRGRIALDDTCCSTAPRASTSRRTAAASAMCSRKAGCSRT